VVVHNNLDYKGQFIIVAVDKLTFAFEKLLAKLPRPIMVVVLDMFVVCTMVVVVEFSIDILYFDLEMIFV